MSLSKHRHLNFLLQNYKKRIFAAKSMDMSNNFFIENLRQSMGMRVFLFLFILLISTLIGVALGAIFVFAGDIGIKIGQGINSIFMFIVPPIVY